MAIDKDPSIYRDRGTIGSSDELDEYGVWVKSEPQVLRADSNGASKEKEATLPDIEDLPDLDLELSEDLPSPDTSGVTLEPTEELVPDFSDLPSFSLDDSEEEPMEEMEESAEDDLIADDSFTELSMDDFLDSEDSAAQDEVAAEAAEEEAVEDINLDFSDEGAEKTEAEKAENDGIALEAVSDFDDFLNELSDQASPTPPPVEAESIDAMPELDIDLDISDEETASIMNAEDVSVELSSSDGIPETIQDEPDLDTHFDDVEALGKDLERDDDVPRRGKADLSTELLMRIADELSSIKEELSSLKGELSVLRSAASIESSAVAESHDEPHGFFDEEDDEKIALTGDELDNILNTADFTEEAGSDAGEEMGAEQPDDSLDFLSDRPDILGEEPLAEEIPIESAQGTESIEYIPAEEPSISETEEIGFEEIGLEIEPREEAVSESADLGTVELGGEEANVEAIELGESENDEAGIESIDLSEDLAIDEPLELAELRESGVRPMTEAPEDTSYLEAEKAEEIDLGESIDLSEAVIDEPDLGDFTLEEPQIEEPSIDSIDIDLDLEENLHVEEIELPIETPEESFENVLPEGFVVDAEDNTPDSEIAAPEEVEEELELEESALEEAPAAVESEKGPAGETTKELPQNLKQEVKAVLSYMDQLLESLPESKIEEFARSEYFDTYKKLFEELGIA